MNSRERVCLAFAHQEPDLVPLFELSIDSRPASELMGREMWVGNSGLSAVRANQMFTDNASGEWLERHRRDTLDLWHNLGLDMIVIPRPTLLGNILVVTLNKNRWRHINPSTGYWEEYVYEPESDMYTQAASSLDNASEADFEAYITRLEQIEQRTEQYDLSNLKKWISEARNMFVLMNSDVPFPPSGKSWGKSFMEWMFTCPDLIDRYLNAQMPERLIVLEEAFKWGVDGVLAGNDWAWGMGPFISPKHLRRFIIPRFQNIVELCHAHNKVIVKHTDGNIRKIEAILFDDCSIDSWHPVDPSAGLTIAEYKARIGSRITLIGNIDCAHTLVTGSRKDVVKETKAAIRAGAPGGGYILSSSNSIHSFVKPDLLLAMLETAREFGIYPIE